MGGKGAKARREAEREAKRKAGELAELAKSQDTKKSAPPTGKFVRAAKKSQSPRKKGPISPQKPKVKKPKHLDRKIKAAQEAGDDALLADLIAIRDSTNQEKNKRLEDFKVMIVNRTVGKVEDEDKRAVIQRVVDRVVGGGSGTNFEKVMAIVKDAVEKEMKGKGETGKGSQKKEKGDSANVNIEDIDEGEDEKVREKVKEKVDDEEDNAEDDEDDNSSDPGSDSSSSSSSSSDTDSESDEDDDAVANMSARGSRGRGKKRAREEPAGDAPKDSSPAPAPPPASEPSPDVFVSRKGQFPEPDPSKKTPKSEDKRRCVGRKPVSDFPVGSKHKGKIVYVKEKLGAFVDIGCHSEGLVFISRLSDEFVKSVGDVVKVGDEVEVRVVEVDRKKKRLTLDMRSDEAIEKEVKGKEEAEERKKMKKAKKGTGTVAAVTADKKLVIPKSMTAAPTTLEIEKEEDKVEEVDESKMTKDELKRYRKIQRRAARRAEAAAAAEDADQ